MNSLPVTDATPAGPVPRTLRMTLSYDGTNYCGWQVQPNGVALQAVVEQALLQFTGESIRVVASGRTDAAVHAIGQVISFVTHSTTPCRGFLHGLPIHLPGDVVVRAVEEVPRGFNARYDARRKWYRYVIHNNPIRIPFLRNYALWQRSRLNEQAMHAAVQCLVGTHDFRCFETQWPNRSSSIRTVFHASVTRTAGWNGWGANVSTPGSVKELNSASESPSVATLAARDAVSEPSADFLCFDIEADGFLYNMVRAIAGTLIHVGRGRWTSQDMRRILEAGDRTIAGETAPPQGLYLMQVGYD
ncbi:MAG: tRNA pseudouridine(38-40) synthase TruA [Planctomycetes bacterium]|nr:tRNA pseudouridine(38-40) synthase TruA [Planctomycetota bacterium]